MSVVWKEETVVFARDRVQVERTALGIVGDKERSWRRPRIRRAQPLFLNVLSKLFICMTAVSNVIGTLYVSIVSGVLFT